MASIIACPPPVADFTGKIDLMANGNAVAIYRDPVNSTEYIRVARAASVDLAAVRWFRIVPEPPEVPPAAGIDPDFGDPPAPTWIDDSDIDAEHLRLMRETVWTLEGEYAAAKEHLTGALREHITATLAWLYRRMFDRCPQCGCRRMTEVTVRSFTGVRAPDGTREMGESTATICKRCGAVVGGGVA